MCVVVAQWPFILTPPPLQHECVVRSPCGLPQPWSKTQGGRLSQQGPERRPVLESALSQGWQGGGCVWEGRGHSEPQVLRSKQRRAPAPWRHSFWQGRTAELARYTPAGSPGSGTAPTCGEDYLLFRWGPLISDPWMQKLQLWILSFKNIYRAPTVASPILGTVPAPSTGEESGNKEDLDVTSRSRRATAANAHSPRIECAPGTLLNVSYMLTHLCNDPSRQA